ncbi:MULTISPECIES: hypothetical protein [unclassified Rhizobacter]|uniref:hypothetical protein n=1 Tax=unclassified Rhizobacter TaxID=2640088 RepID=UPI000AF7CD4B|nr:MULTISPECIES: hypothetical protein [unclassified Rhizobacter]
MRPVSPCIGTLPIRRELSAPQVFAPQKSAIGHLGLKFSIVPATPPAENFLKRYNPSIGNPAGGDLLQSNDLPQ